MEQLTDEALIGHVRQGCRDAYRILVERHKDHVFTLIRCKVGERETAEDLAQEVFLKLYRSLSQFRGESQFSTWLYRLTVNTVTDYQRSKKRRTLTAAVMDTLRGWFVEGSSELRYQPEESAIRKEERETVVKLLLQLPERYRDILYLYHYRQLSYAEIAQLLELPLKTVETRLYRGKSLLKQQWLEVHGHEQQPSKGPNPGAVSKPELNG